MYESRPQASRVSSQGLLAESDSIVNDGKWDQLNTLLDRVQNQPNNMKANLRGATAGETPCSTAGRRIIMLSPCTTSFHCQMPVSCLNHDNWLCQQGSRPENEENKLRV